MSWKQFHFKCRFFLQKINEGQTLNQTSQLFEQSNLTTLYAKNDLTSIQKELFDKVLNLSSREDAQRALTILSSIDLAESLTSSKVYKSIMAKLGYLEAISVVFIVFISIYKAFVFPVFSSLVQQYPSIGSNTFELMPFVWGLGLISAAFTLIATFLFRKYVKNIDKFIIKLPSNKITFFIPQKALNEIIKLNKIIKCSFSKNSADDDFSDQLNAVNNMGLDESVELSSLFAHHSEQLEMIIQQQAKRMLTIFYTVLTLAIAFYILQVYDPIFKLGAIIQ
ncbi:hypothetical protein [Thalassotalea piscium]|uniref:Type II secretion system protein GspF domain-containing protein n=1 Tax=Thalassotalea piscium TaxID=1230533 RepID=A0A7X0NE33_9GAMM|nr:hypothetical protein [Thalassotalea piscium]MBB6541715.1 hypothetical protein [Thalassotalea piscium]